ncbi:aminopeptidase C [Corynebacterium kroppenstedtii]|uniref:aminopeptidase C n=1 Tax=Corynebacterium sp. PCR 32 TaxID=3351342 RepID=UPI0030A6EFBF
MDDSSSTPLDTALSEHRLATLRSAIDDDPTHRVAMNAITTTDVDHVALHHSAVVALDETSEIKLDSLNVTDQKQSGRCWMFAALNVFRHDIARSLNVDDFEFSESYLQFFDKFEKANYFLRSIAGLYDGTITPADNPSTTGSADELRNRSIDTLYTNTISDGGQWNYLVNVVKKYGAVPKYAMPETQSSSSTPHMDRALNTIVRKAALQLKAALTTDATRPTDTTTETPDTSNSDSHATTTFDPNGIISAALRDVHRVLSIHLGTPPTTFVWQYRDKDNHFHRGGTYTPHQFAQEFLPNDLDQYVNIAHDPRTDIPFGHRYTTQFQNDMWGTDDFTYLNVELPTLKALAIQRLRTNKPVFFACDVNRQFRADLGVWDANLIQVDQIYGTDTTTTKADRMLTAESRLTHAMVFTGVDFLPDTETPRRWRVENSWGTRTHNEHDDIAGADYGTMSDSWFDDNVFQIVVHRDELPNDLRARLDEPPTLLPIWDAMV